MATYTSNYGWTKPSGSDNVDISVLNDNLDDQDSTIHDAFLNMAPPFSESATYAVDDIVLYGTGLYKCHTAVVTPGSWTGSTNWQVYKLSEGGSGGGGTTNYNALTNKPQINSVELSGNKTAAQLGLMASDGVVANPTGQTTGTLTALEVGGTKYAVPSGGGGTSDYTDLTNKPSINGVTLLGNKTTSDLGLQGELTFDNVPTDGSNNPVKSDGIYDSEKDIYAVMGQMGAKNLNSYPYYETSHTDNGIDWTDNGDGTVTADGTATGNSALICHSRVLSHSNPLIVPNGKYILSGCPSGGTGTTYYVSAAVTKNGSSVSLGIDYGSGVEITLDGDDNYTDRVRLQIACNVRNGYTANNLTFKPMLRLASDTDDTYQPYAKTNRELTESYPANKVMMSDGVTSVEEALGGSNLTDITDWEENASYPAGTALPSDIWTWIGHKILQPGIYYISCVANLTTGSTTAVSLLQQIRDLTHDKVLTADSVTAPQRSFPSSCIVALTEPTDIYFDVYVGGSASVYARAYRATKLF